MIIVWLQIAAQERIEQLEHIAQDSPLAAADQDEKIDEAIDVLSSHPMAGRAGRVKGTRELVVSGTSFIAIYRRQSDPERVEIIRFLHGAQRCVIGPPSGARMATQARYMHHNRHRFYTVE